MVRSSIAPLSQEEKFAIYVKRLRSDLMKIAGGLANAQCSPFEPLANPKVLPNLLLRYEALKDELKRIDPRWEKWFRVGGAYPAGRSWILPRYWNREGT